MGKKQKLKEEIDKLKAELALLESIPEDSYPVGTVSVFQTASGPRWYYLKKADELWERMSHSTPERKELAEWILETKNMQVGYFEVYALIAEDVPFYASE